MTRKVTVERHRIVTSKARTRRHKPSPQLVAPVALPAEPLLATPSLQAVRNTFAQVAMRRGTKRMVAVWAKRGLPSAIAAERDAIVKEVEGMLRRDGQV